VIRVGDRVTVQVGKVDGFKKQVDFNLVKVARTSGKKTPTRQQFGMRHGKHT
jgi:hypothetical protein